MFRSIVKTSLLSTRSSLVYRQPAVRSISSTAILYKSKKKGSNKKGAAQEQDDEVIVEDPSHVLPNLEAKLKECLEQHKKAMAETKLGSANPKIFDKISVEVNKKPQIFTSLAQTAIKGRNLIITVFDPNNTKHIVSAILASGLNINPEPIPNTPQQLKVPLPPPTSETKQQIAKELKKDFEKFKNSNDKHSISTARSATMKELKSFDQKSDQLKKIVKDAERIYKKYADELQAQYKAAEKSVLK